MSSMTSSTEVPAAYTIADHDLIGFADRESQNLTKHDPSRYSLLGSPASKSSDAAPSLGDPRTLSGKGWLWEILSLVGSLCGLGAVVGVLAFYDGKPAPTWYQNITLNALVSVLATLFKGTLLMPIVSSIGQCVWLRLGKEPMTLDGVCVYDRASRGPLGSLLFIFGHRIFHLAALGALLTVAATALDTFFQQTITYSVEPMVETNSDAMVAMAQRWTYIYPGTTVDKMPIYDAESAAYSSLFQSGVKLASSPPFSCPSGNCTWDPFTTLAMRLQCQDVRSKLQTACGGPVGYCNLSTSDSMLGTALPDPSQFVQSQAMSIVSIPGLDLDQSPDLVRRWGKIPGITAIIPWLRVNGSQTTSLMFTTANSSIEAQVCIFYTAVIEVEATVTNGAYSENVLREFGGIDDVVSGISYNGSSSETIVQSITKDGIPWYQINRMSTSMESYTYQPDLGNTTKHPLQFEVNAYLANSLSLILADNARNGIFAKPDTVDTIATRSLGQVPNVTQSLERMASYMSYALRMNGSLSLPPDRVAAESKGHSYAPVAFGKTYSQVQFVHIRWAWLALPAVCLVLAIVLTFTAIIQSRTRNIGLWKTSPLTLLFHANIDKDSADSLHEKTGLLRSGNGMENIGAGMRARLAHDTRGVKSAINISDAEKQDSWGKKMWWKLKRAF